MPRPAGYSAIHIPHSPIFNPQSPIVNRGSPTLAYSAFAAEDHRHGTVIGITEGLLSRLMRGQMKLGLRFQQKLEALQIGGEDFHAILPRR